MKKTLLLMSLALIAGSATARQIGENEARTIAASKVPALGKNAKRVLSKGAPAAQKYAPVYMFSSPAGGFAIVAGDDCMPNPVLAYSDNAQLDIDNCAPAMKAWLDEMSAFIAAGDFSRLHSPSADYSTPVAPLLTTKWNQDAPYNLLTPLGTTGEHCPTGCAATAIAQVLNYWQWPKEGGLAEHSYEWNGETLSVDFRESRYDWDNMADVYDDSSTEAQNNAVAKLMSDCGVACDMDYGDDESGTLDSKVANGLVDYLGYNPGIRLLSRNFFSDDDWFALVNEELDSARPVPYFAATPNDEGHAFVCDGYDESGLYHINWGWGGLCDGYFDLSTLDPDIQGIGGASSGMSFSEQQTVFTGVRPAQEGDVASVGWELCLTDFDIRPEDEDSSKYVWEWEIYNLGYRSFVGSVVLFYHREGDPEEEVIESHIYHDPDDRPLLPNDYLTLGIGGIYASNFEDGVYHMWLEGYDDETHQYVPLHIPNKCIPMRFEIKDGKMNFEYRPHLKAELSEIDEVGFYYTSGNLRYTVSNLTFQIENTSDIWFVGNLALTVSYPDDDEDVCVEETYLIAEAPQIGPGEMYEITVPVQYNVNGDVNFSLASCSLSEEQVAQEVVFEGSEYSIKGDGVYCELALAYVPEVSVDSGAVTITAQVGCCTGDVILDEGLAIDEEAVTVRDVICTIYNTESDQIAATATATYSGVWNEIKTLTFTAGEPLEVGDYYAELTYRSAPTANGDVLDITLGEEDEDFQDICFSITTTGISGIMGDNADGNVEVYSVCGQRMSAGAELAPGCYFVVRGGKAHKVIVK